MSVSIFGLYEHKPGYCEIASEQRGAIPIAPKRSERLYCVLHPRESDAHVGEIEMGTELNFRPGRQGHPAVIAKADDAVHGGGGDLRS